MVTGTGSGPSAEMAAPPLEGERSPRSEPFWSWFRFIVLFVLAIGLGTWGLLLRPSAARPIRVSLPQVTVLANKQDVTARVDMKLVSNLREKKPYSLTLTITPANPSQSVTFAVSFKGFPKPAAGSGILYKSHNAFYTMITWTPGMSGVTSQGKPFTFKSAGRIGESSSGPQLRVAFPDLIGEQPGSQACGLAASLQGSDSTICAQLGNQPQWTPLLEAGTSTFSSPDPALGNYQYLAGDDPTLLGGNTWMWSGINGVTMLAASVQEQDNEQNDLFYGGLLLGVAAAAGIMCLTELLRPAWRRGTSEPTPGQSGK
jgi:hypothetical protein